MNNKEMIVPSFEAGSNSELGGNKSASEKNDVEKAEDLKSSNDDCRQEREQEKQNQQEQQDQQQNREKEHGEQQAGKEKEEYDNQEQEQLEQSCSQTTESTFSSLQSSVIVQNPISCNSTETAFIAPNSPSSSSSTSKNNGDSTFEPTVDMMVNDFDDEQTLEEEEALAAQECEDPTAELSSLQKESDMPIEELLALYNCNGAAMMHMNENRNKKAAKSSGSGYNKRKLKPQRMISSSSSNHECNEENDVGDNCGSGDRNGGVSGDQIMSGEHNDEDEDDDDDIDEGDDEDDDDEDDDNLKDSQLRKLYPETYGNSNDKRLLRTISRQQSDEEDDGEYSPDEDELKKTIMVGSEFQAVIPEGFSKYDDALPYENEDKLLWDPSNYNEVETEEYLQNSKALNIANNDNVPGGNHLRDDEQALYLLLQCGYNPVEALRRKRLNTVPSSSDEMSIWSEEECRNFESGVRVYGKDFYTIKHTKVRTRSVGELVQFYYLWKKTERHDVFANKARLEKKKYSLHPGLTDYMDRFLEEQDTNNGNTSNSTTMMNLRDRSSSPAVVNSLLQADTKRLKIHHHNQSSLSSYHHHHHYHGSSSNSLIGSSNNSNEKIMNRMSSASTSSMIPTTSTATAPTSITSDKKDNDNNINLSSSMMTTTVTNNSGGSTNNNRSHSSLSSALSLSSSTTIATATTSTAAASPSSLSLSASNQDGGNSNAS